MKATQSKDGTLRFNVPVSVRVGKDELINALCWQVLKDHWTDIQGCDNKAMAFESCLRGLRSRKAVFEAVRRAVLSDGVNYWAWSDELKSEDADKLREQVRVIVSKKFPELN
jgi:hypothetical protein